MSVISNSQGPLSAQTSITPSSELQALINIDFHLLTIIRLLQQGFGLSDSDAGIRNSTTVTDLAQVS